MLFGKAFAKEIIFGTMLPMPCDGILKTSVLAKDTRAKFRWHFENSKKKYHNKLHFAFHKSGGYDSITR